MAHEGKVIYERLICLEPETYPYGVDLLHGTPQGRRHGMPVQIRPETVRKALTETCNCQRCTNDNTGMLDVVLRVVWQCLCACISRS